MWHFHMPSPENNSICSHTIMCTNRNKDLFCVISCSLLPAMDKKMQGMMVSYKIKVTLIMGGGLLGSLTTRLMSLFSFNIMAVSLCGVSWMLSLYQSTINYDLSVLSLSFIVLLKRIFPLIISWHLLNEEQSA